MRRGGLLRRASRGQFRLVWHTMIRTLDEVPDLSRAERRRIATEAMDRARAAAGTPDAVVPGRFTPPGAARPTRRLLQALPVVLGLAFFFSVSRLAPPIGTTAGLSVRAAAFVTMLGLVWAALVVVARPVHLPYVWAILRERGIDACLHCGGIGAGSGRAWTRCPECGERNPPSPDEQHAEPPADRDAATVDD